MAKYKSLEKRQHWILVCGPPFTLDPESAHFNGIIYRCCYLFSFVSSSALVLLVTQQQKVATIANLKVLTISFKVS